MDNELFNLDNILNPGIYKLHLNESEALFLDWITTLHSWDYELYERLNKPEIKDFKYQLGKILLKQSTYIELEKDVFQYLFTICPCEFRWGYGENFGLIVKMKLYCLLLTGKDIDEEAERKKTEEAQKQAQAQQTSSYDY